MPSVACKRVGEHGRYTRILSILITPRFMESAQRLCKQRDEQTNNLPKYLLATSVAMSPV